MVVLRITDPCTVNGCGSVRSAPLSVESQGAGGSAGLAFGRFLALKALWGVDCRFVSKWDIALWTGSEGRTIFWGAESPPERETKVYSISA